MKLEKLSGVELGLKVNNREISTVEVIRYFKSYVEKENPNLNAFVYTQFDEAEDVAKSIDERLSKGEYVGPFAGVPTGLKDFLPTKKGWTASHGGVKSLITVDICDSEFCKSVEKLGAIPIGKTNAPSFGFRGTTDNYMYGPTSNPFDYSRNSGGSSGGSASAVGGGLIPFAEGGDAGGSIRIPASWCNCFGFKPSAGLVPSICRPDAWTATHPYCCGGPITRTVGDAAIILTTMSKYDRRDPVSAPCIRDNFTKSLTPNLLKGMKIGLTFDFDLFPTPDNEICSIIESTAKLLEKAGASVNLVNFDFKYKREDIEHAWLLGISIDTAIDMKIWAKYGYDLWKDFNQDVSEEFLKCHSEAATSGILDYRNFTEIRTDILDAHLDVFENYDIILSPVTGCLPVKNSSDRNTLGPDYINNEKVDKLIGFGYTYLENMIGFPAASIPAGFSQNLPVGMQIIAPRYNDKDVFAVSYMLERLNPWRDNYKF